jgi:ADP-heptose:LPS heptosyltransferase
MLFLISAIAKAGFRPFGHVREQLRMVWHRYKLMLLLSASWRSALFSSRESAIQRYDWSSTAGPRYSSWFHQYDGQEVEQQAQRMHS